MKNYTTLPCFFKLIILLNSILSLAQELPPIINFSPLDYKAENQNWAITQGSDKFIYVANNKGLLQYNGSQWKLYASPNESIIRTVKSVGKRIYSGAFMDFGYWEKNSKGELNYVSIVNNKELKLKEDEQIWNILNYNEWILFQSLNSIYIFNPTDESLSTITTNKLIFKSYIVNNTVYFQVLGAGLFKVLNGKAKLILDNELFKNEPIINLFNASRNSDEIVLVTQSKGFYKGSIVRDNFNKWEISAFGTLKNTTVYNSKQLKNGDFVIGTIANGVFVIDKEGVLVYKIDQSNGLLNNTVLTIFEDKDFNIWLGLDNGINCINHTSSVKIFNDKDGKLGTVYTSVLYNNNLYLGTNQGLFVRKFNEKKSKFNFVKGTQGQVWTLQLFDNKLFCGHNNGTFIVENEKVIKKIAAIAGTWLFREIGLSKNKILQGNYDGLYVLEKSEGKWNLSHKINGFNISSRHFEVFNDTIFVNHEYKGVYVLKVDKEFKRIEKLKVHSNLKGKNSSLNRYKNSLFYAYKNGVFKYHFNLNEFKKDSIYSKLYTENTYRTGKLIYFKNKDVLWGFNAEEFVYLTPGKFSEQPEINFFSMPSALEKSMSGFENLLELKNDNYLFGNSIGYYIFNANNKTKQNYKLLLNSIEVNDKNDNFQKLELVKKIVLPNALNSINVNFSVPQYNAFEKVLYQCKLVGYKNEWSKWDKVNNVHFENLPAGKYKLFVRAKVDDVLLESKIQKEIIIKKIWYFSNIAIIIYALLAVGILYVLKKYYQSRYEKQKEKTLINIKNELALKDLENKKQLIEIENQRLIQDIENKNRELAISTMSLVKKNEFLSNIKKELLSKKDNSSVEDVIKIIDKNISTKKDWELFQQAFDNADKDFLQKIKAKHPSLTPNDLKLCAYLRLNLSSKEIAPLLNISPRSVEVKRYRLRKKMELNHETSLTNYILEI